MRRLLSAPALAAALLTLLVPAALATTTPIAGQMRYAVDGAAANASFAQAGRDQFVILNEWESSKIATIKAQNPQTKVLMYKNLAFMGAADQWGHTGAGVTTQQAASNPAWYLTTLAGKRFTSNSYNWLWAADIGSRGYQDQWTDNVTAKLQAGGFDGVFIDDVNPTMSAHYDVTQITKYPTDTAYATAMGSAIANIGPKLHAAGKLAIANFGEWRLHRATVNNWLDYLDGGMEEMYTKWGGPTANSGYAPTPDWQAQVDAQKDAEAKNKYFLAVAHSAANDTQAARYGWATLLLNANGHSSFGLHADYTNQPTQIADYDTDLGDPTSTDTTNPNGTHQRTFTNAIALANPTNQTQTINLPGTYTGNGLTNTTTITLGPHRGAVLRTHDPATTDELRSGVRAKLRWIKRNARSLRAVVACPSGGLACVAKLRVTARHRTLGRRSARIQPGSKRLLRVSLRYRRQVTVIGASDLAGHRWTL